MTDQSEVRPEQLATGYSLGQEAPRRCPACSERTWHAAVQVMVLTPGGARSMLLWECERHPLPATMVAR